MPCSTDSVLDSSTSSSAYYTVRITCPVLKSPKPSRTSLGRYKLYKFNRIGDSQNKIKINIYYPAKKWNWWGPNEDHKMGSAYDTHNEDQKHMQS